MSNVSLDITIKYYILSNLEHLLYEYFHFSNLAFKTWFFVKYFKKH